MAQFCRYGSAKISQTLNLYLSITKLNCMLVKFGNFIFHYRNFLFPVFYAALFIPSAPLFDQVETAVVLGSVIIALGILTRCITIGLVYIIRGGVKRQIYAEKLVTGGIYEVCRNPMYLGNILLILGFGFFANSILFLLVFFPVFCLFYLAIIKAEENFLSYKFGEEFVQYCRQTNALLPNITKIGQAFKEHEFHFKRVLAKEYNSLFLYSTGILALSFYHKLVLLNTVLIIFGILLMIYLATKWAKKKKMLE
jgi:protein-S-isoprenylcysteine O-methyltransferase Ste14